MCWACSMTESSPTVDAGVDAGAPEDASRRPRIDAGTLEDAEVDAFVDTSWLRGLKGDWDPVACPGSKCYDLIARDPASSVGALQWQPCTSGRAGCLELVVDWTDKRGTVMNVSGSPYVIVGSDGVPRFVHTKIYPTRDYGGPDRMVMAVYPMLGAPIFALAADFTIPNQVVYSWPQLSSVGIHHVFSSSSQRTVRYRSNTYASLGTFSQYDLSVEQHGAAPSGALAGMFPNGSRVLTLLDGGGQRIVDPAAVTSKAFGPGLDGPKPTSNGFFGLGYANGWPLSFVGNDARQTVVRKAPLNRTVSGFAIDQSLHRLVWAESTGIGPDALDSVLYESPLVEKESDLVARRITAFDDPGGFGGGYMIANKGSVAIRVSDTRVIVTNVSDGDSWIIDADPGKSLFEPLWIDEKEVWLNVGTIRGNRADFDSIIRISRDSLGPPTIVAH